MKYIKGHYVDAKTGISSAERSMKNGPALPSEDITVDAVDRRPSPALVIGTVPDGTTVPNAFEEITQEEHTELLQSYNDWRDQYEARQLQKARDNAKLTRSEFKLALLEINELDNVKAAIDDSGVDPRAVILWEDALHFHRTDSDLLRLAEELGYTEDQLDSIFGIS